jgi:hypothetical protein
LLSSEKYSDGMADLMDVLIREHWTEHLPEDLLNTVVRGPRRNLDRAVFEGRIYSIQSTTSFRSSDVIRTFSGLTQPDRDESATQESERNYLMAPRPSAPQTTLSRNSCRQESIAAILCREGSCLRDRPAISQEGTRSPSGQAKPRVWFENSCQCQVERVLTPAQQSQGFLTLLSHDDENHQDT